MASQEAGRGIEERVPDLCARLRTGALAGLRTSLQILKVTVPLFTGIFLGIAYGAGIIIRAAQEKRLPSRELFLIGLFLATCHAVVEDTLIFVVIGGDPWVMLGVRLVVAVFLTAVTARLLKSGGPSPSGS